MNVVVTGSSGVLGAAAAARLAARGDGRVLGYDRTDGGCSSFETRLVDLLEPGTGFQWPEDTEAVLHLAGSWMPAHPTADGLVSQVRTNVELTARALAACGPGVRRFVFVSSMSVYGAAAEVPFREAGAVVPDTFYGRTKWLGEAICRVAAEARPGLSLVVLRLAQVYGPGTPPRVVLYDFIDQALTSGAIRAKCAPGLLRDHIHLTDAAEALELAVTRAPPGTYNVGAGGHTMGELAAAIREASAQPVTISFGDAPGVSKVVDSTAFRAATGFAPRTSLREGIRLELARRTAERELR